MLSQPPSARDLRAIHELVTHHRDQGVGDAARERLRAMHLVMGPPYELTARGRLLLATLFALLFCACGGPAFELAELDPPDSSPLSAQEIDAAETGVAFGQSSKKEPPAIDARSSLPLEQLDASADLAVGVSLDDARGPDVLTARDASPEVIDAHSAGDALQASARGDGGAEGEAAEASPPACSSTESFTYKTPPGGCGCETPPTYSCYAWGVVCGSCPADIDASPFGPLCGMPSACQVGAPCHWQALAGGVVSGSVTACP